MKINVKLRIRAVKRNIDMLRRSLKALNVRRAYGLGNTLTSIWEDEAELEYWENKLEELNGVAKD